MPDLFSVSVDDADVGYRNVRAGVYQVERELREALEAMWATYEPYADRAFVEAFARTPDPRFWEMFLGCQLLAAGKTLLPTSDRQRRGGQPDICVVEGSSKIWIEAIAPDVGDAGPDQVRGPVPVNEGGGLVPAPIRQAQLRTTSALWTKTQKVDRYRRDGVIARAEPALIAIGAGRFGIYVPEEPLPLVLSAVFPIGPEVVTLNVETGVVSDPRFQPSFQIERTGGTIPRTAFLEPQFSGVAGVIWSRASIGNMSRQDRPLSLVHNPLATAPMPTLWGVWDREFVTTRSGDEWLTTDLLARDSPQLGSIVMDEL